MDQQSLLTRLVKEQYAQGNVVLRPISPYMFDDRGIYQVETRTGHSYVLRAFHYDNVEESLRGQVAVLTYLTQRAYPVPTVIPTSNDTTLAVYEGWTALLLSFLTGTQADFSPHNLMLLGKYLGYLHTFTHNAQTNASHLPDSRLRPTQISQQMLEHWESLLDDIPQALRSFYQASISTIRRMQQATQLPITVIHGDCWPGNAILTSLEQLAMIDWDGAGLAPAVLDLGYLLMTCHLGKPQLPAMQADRERIAAVVQGYCQQRSLTTDELLMLEDAVQYDVARRAMLASSPPTEGWQADVSLLKSLARYTVGHDIAAIAQHYFKHTEKLKSGC